MPEYATYIDTVVVIESLRPGDLKTGTGLFDQVIRPLAVQQNLRSVFRAVRSKKAFFTYLNQLTTECRQGGHSPVLHIECHGSEDGIEIAGEFVAWKELKPYLIALNTVSQLNLLVVLVACSGGHLARVVTPVDRAPVWGLLGPKKPMEAGRLFRDLSAFYRTFLSTLDGRRALEAMNGGPPSPSWSYSFIPSEWFFKVAYRSYVNQETTPHALARRADWIVAQVLLRRALPKAAASRLRRQTLRQLGNQEHFFNEFRRRFFMTDLYPRNALRFPLSYSDVAYDGTTAA